MFIRPLGLSFILLCLLFSLSVQAQQSSEKPAEQETQVLWREDGSSIHFDSELRPLRQIAGAPETFYTYFWELGDGNFSFNEKPTYQYKEAGEYEVRLYATNNYDDGKAPPTRPVRIAVTEADPAAGHSHSGFFDEKSAVQLKVNRQPRPDENMICVVGYRNIFEDEEDFDGSVALFYNEEQFKKNNFGLSDIRRYHQEEASSMDRLVATLSRNYLKANYALNDVGNFGPADPSLNAVAAESQAVSLLMHQQELFRNHSIVNFSGLEEGEERYLFMELHTTPEMIKDTNATVKLTAMLIPNDPDKEIQISTLDLQIVASHDPNRMMLSNRRMNYRFMGQNKTSKYKVRFQNTGKGPAKRIDVGVSIPPLLDPSTLSLEETYPKVAPCEGAYGGQSCLDTIISQDSIHFIFNNIYLPGLRQEGVEDKDSTKGFVQYTVQFREKPPKIPFYSQADIVFDNNKPVYTNRMHTRFIRGISPTLIAGHTWGLKDVPNSWMIGGAIAPYSPYRWFGQAELYMTISQKDQITTPLDKRERDTLIDNLPYVVTGGDEVRTKEYLKLNLVPLQIRKNFTSFFAAGAGIWLQGTISEKTTIDQNLYLRYLGDVRPPSQGGKEPLSKVTQTSVQKSSAFATTNLGAFVDIGLGKVRVGPSVGARLVHFFSPKETGVMVYASWRL